MPLACVVKSCLAVTGASLSVAMPGALLGVLKDSVPTMACVVLPCVVRQCPSVAITQAFLLAATDLAVVES